MQINRINTVVTKKSSRKSSDRNNNNINNNNINPKFKGIGVGLDKLALGTANLIENGGLAVSFTLQDMLGTNLPRPIMGLKRNSKENKGEKNFKFAAKEVVREMLTGPSMFLIPMALLGVAKKTIGATVNTPMKLIKDFGAIHSANPLDAAGKVIGKEGFFKNVFTEILKNAKLESTASEATIEKAAQYAKKLAENVSDKNVVTNLFNDFVDVSKKHANNAFADFTVAKISSNTSVPFKDTVQHMISYADDVVAKVANQNSTNNIAKYIKNITDKKIVTRAGMNIAMYAAVISFLRIIPKLYNKAEGEGNAGLKGLMKEETLNDSPSNSNRTKNKSNPSFGSAVPQQVVETLTGNGKGLSGKILGKLAQWSEYSGPNVSFPFLLGIMGLGILLPRLTQAKDKYDREEILRRDLVTCATMCFGEHILRKGFSKVNENSSGFVLADKGQGFRQQNIFKRIFDYIRPIKGVNILSTDQIVSKYSDLEKYNGGIKGFCSFIDAQGGNLSKVFSLNDEAKILTENIVGRPIKGIDNRTIKEAIAKNMDSADVKKLTELFLQKDNPWVNKAKTLNARFTALSVLVLVPVFLGFMLPAINERATKKRINKEKEELMAQQNPTSINMMSNLLFQNRNSNKIFSQFNKF